MRRLLTSASVTDCHLDKISDAVLDALLKTDASRRVAVKTMITSGQVHVAGEVFDLRPAAIVRDLDLLRPAYTRIECTWEDAGRAAGRRVAAGL